MSSHIYIPKPVNELIHVEENEYSEKNKSKIGNSGNPNGSTAPSTGEALKPKDFSQEDIITSHISETGEINAIKIENGEIPVLNTKYIESDRFYEKTYESDQSLSALKEEFSQDKYKRFSIFGKQKEDSKEMKAVMNSVEDLVGLLEDDITADMSETAFNDALGKIEEKYRTIVANCSTYLFDTGKNKKNLRYSLVKRMHTTATRELSLIRDIAENTYEALHSGEGHQGVKWSSVLRDCRSLHFKDGENGVKVKKTGENSSNIDLIEINGKKMFFKKDEDVKEYSLDEAKTKLKTGLENPDIGLSEPELAQAKNFLNNILEELNKYSTGAQIFFIEGLHRIADLGVEKGSVTNFFKKYLGTEDVRPFMGLISKTRNLLADTSVEGSENQEYKDNAEKIKARIKNNQRIWKIVFAEVGRNLFEQNYVKSVAKIPVGAKITTNNVATSRVADLLKLDFVAKSKSTIISVNGTTKKGILMEEAKGEEVEDVKKELSDVASIHSKATEIITQYESLESAVKASQPDINYMVQEARKVLKALNVFTEKEDPTNLDQAEILEKIKTNINNKELKKHGRFRELLKKYNSAMAATDILEDFKNKFQNSEPVKEYKKLMKLKDEDIVTVDDIKQKKKELDTNKNGYKTTYSAKVKRDLTSLSIFDFIMGQTDRHIGNYHVETKQVGEKLVISKLNVLDNDGCCGTYTGKQLDQTNNIGVRTTRLKKNGKINIPALDLEFAKRVLELTPDTLAMSLMDLLTKEQLKAMADRLKYVQDIIRGELKKFNKNKSSSIKFLSTEEEWENYGKEQNDANMLYNYNKYLFRPQFMEGTQ